MHFGVTVGEAKATKTATGCRPDALFGVWAIDPGVLESLVRAAEGVDLVQARELAAQAPEVQPYRMLAGGVAAMEIRGPMSKYTHSLQSVLGGVSSLRTRDALRQATRDKAVKAIMVTVDSPGGTVTGTGDLAEAIAAAAKVKPVHARVEDQCASAALHAVSGATRISANASAWLGSIGSFAVLRDTSAQAEAQGIKYRVISSGGVKGANVDGVPISAEVAAETQRIVDTVTEQFVSAISRGRGIPMKRARELADGRVHAAKDAQALGLIDAVETDEQALKALMREVVQMTKTDDSAAALALAEEQEARANTLAQENTKLKAELATLKASSVAPPADPLASLTLEQKALFETERQARVAAEAQASALEAKQRTERFVAEAKQLGLPNEAADVLAAVEQKVGVDAFAKLRGHIAGLSAQVKTGKLFEELGSSGAAGGAQTIEDLARASVKAGKHKTMAEAIVAIAEQNPDLYAQHAGKRG